MSIHINQENREETNYKYKWKKGISNDLMDAKWIIEEYQKTTLCPQMWWLRKLNQLDQVWTN